MRDIIEKRVHELYWDLDVNCDTTTLLCLGQLFHVEINPQTINSAIGLHGAGGYRAQCGLVEGTLMFIGIYLSKKDKTDKELSEICYQFAEKFTEEYGSLRCFDLRPNGFNEDDPQHACEKLTVDAITFAHNFIADFHQIISIFEKMA